ncbi:MarR family winged helix-turn-helix transcriptional regulator [Pseudomonas umsongensis]|uniref:MarR family winged helix-turn-helix transcriptional regulator n=1 Tax=Pseudomonas umsongensis TaxID=198618 RepID=UPI00200A9E75|nr:MarR family transcriptional regulator [Pseudomonas umsongensis]MCK8683317.1 MarR family transcriptional regulator [Pseudomonas umsongensis]
MTMPSGINLSGQVLEQPGFLFTDIARLYRIALDRRMQKYDLTRSQSWMVSFLCYFDGSTQQQLADLMGTGKGGIGKLVDRLEQKGLVTRVVDAQDCRSKRIFLSAHIKPIAQEMEREIDQLVTDSLRDLQESDVAQLKNWLKTIRMTLLGAVMV